MGHLELGEVDNGDSGLMLEERSNRGLLTSAISMEKKRGI